MSAQRDSGRRKQFSSCDACRRSRVRCVSQEGPSNSPSRLCAHCEKRGLRCTYEWLQKPRRPGLTKHVKHQRSNISPNTMSNGDLGQHLWSLFSAIFEPVFAIWLNDDCCPYGDRHKSHVPGISQIVLYLDTESCECSSDHLRSCTSVDPLLKQALDRAVCCFSARWLFLIDASDNLDDLARTLWLEARTALFKVIDRPSYQSILALYLFSMTPLPPGLDNEDADSHLGEVFVQIALRQFHVVRAKRRNRQFSGSKIMEGSPLNQSNFSEQFTFYENLVYWAGFMIDTATSMTLGRPSTLCAGILGFASEPIFQLLRARSQVLQNEWPQSTISRITDDRALQIISSAAAYECYFWKMISVLREAIVYGHQENEAHRVQKATIDALTYYRTTYLPLLVKCERSLIFLKQQTRLGWYLVNVNYNMSIFILCDVLTCAGRTDIIPDLKSLEAESVQEILNTVEFARKTFVSFSDTPLGNLISSTSNPLCLLSIDPYPHHLVATLQSVIDHLLPQVQQELISQVKMRELSDVVISALDSLPQCSHSLQNARKDIETKIGLNSGEGNTL